MLGTHEKISLRIWKIMNIQEAIENFVFPDKCSFLLIAMTKSLNKSAIAQQTLHSL